MLVSQHLPSLRGKSGRKEKEQRRNTWSCSSRRRKTRIIMIGGPQFATEGEDYQY
jgi:hypothetical protein